jgi:polyisoprenoid-binding protein YceI
MSDLASMRSGTWQIDALHSQVMVSVRHFSVANLRAKFPVVRGSLLVDLEDPSRSRFDAEIESASVTTGHPRQEEYMRSEPWLDAERYPLITFKGTAMEPGPTGILVKGDLTLRGVTRSLDLPVEFNGVVADPWGLRAGFTSEFVVDRRDFGITWDRIFDWGLMAGHELTFTLDIELAYPDTSLAQAPQQVS